MFGFAQIRKPPELEALQIIRGAELPAGAADVHPGVTSYDRVTVIELRRNPGPLRFFLDLLAVLGFYQYLSYATPLSRNNLLPPWVTLWLPVAVVYVLVTTKFWKLAFSRRSDRKMSILAGKWLQPTESPLLSM